MMPLCSSYKHGMFVVFAVLLHFNKQLLHSQTFADSESLLYYYLLKWFDTFVVI